MLERPIAAAHSHTAPESGFRHEAMFYAGLDEFVAGSEAFVREGLRNGEAVLVVVDQGKIDGLAEALGSDAHGVAFADMAEVGANPGRIIPAWRRFVDEHQGRPIRGIGEPIYPERTSAEMVECHRHEALLNLAFARDAGFTLMCPYDVTALEPEVIAEAQRNHPFELHAGSYRGSATYTGLGPIAAPFDAALPEPGAPTEIAFPADAVWLVRRLVATFAERFGLSDERKHDLVLAISEVAGNSARHAPVGQGMLRIWEDGDMLVCEVRDGGRIDDPLAGRRQPGLGQEGGYGLWLANRLCDLVQVRSFADGSVVRLHMRRG